MKPKPHSLLRSIGKHLINNSKTPNRYTIVLLTLIILAFIRCEIYTEISSSADVNTDFSKYKTFAWLPDKTDSTNQPYNNEVIRNNIRNYFGQCFAERGYTVDLEKPDLLLRVIIANTKKEKEYVLSPYPWSNYYCNYYYGSIYYFPYDFNYYYRYPSAYCYPNDDFTQKYEYIEGSITLNVIDRNQNKMVWSGTARGDIYDPSYFDENIHPAVEAIMKKYPVKPKSKKMKVKKIENNDVYNEDNLSGKK